jgi:hypothetical protein
MQPGNMVGQRLPQGAPLSAVAPASATPGSATPGSSQRRVGMKTRVDLNDQVRSIGTQIDATQKGFLPFEQVARDQVQLSQDYERLRMSHELAREIALERDLESLLDKILETIFRFVRADRGVKRDAGVEFDSSAKGLADEDLKAFRKKRLLGDLLKFAGIAFYVSFVVLVPDAKKAPGVSPVLAATIFSFLMSGLAYFQCFNYSAKKRMNEV